MGSSAPAAPEEGEDRSRTAPDDDARLPDGLDGADRYVPGLDGLRAIAVVAVMAYPAGVIGGGFLGVDLFFVVSGFLITDLLLEDAANHGRVRLARFWGRRARRLGPALLLVLGVTLVWAYLAASPSMAQTTSRQVGWSLAYLSNWFAVFGDVGYWGAETTKTPLNHLWSLAVEEQFYVAWPLVVSAALAVTRRLGVLAGVAAAGMVASAGWQWWVAGSDPERAYLGTDTRAVALLTGCLLAVFLARTGARRPTSAPVHTGARSGADGPAGEDVDTGGRPGAGQPARAPAGAGSGGRSPAGGPAELRTPPAGSPTGTLLGAGVLPAAQPGDAVAEHVPPSPAASGAVAHRTRRSLASRLTSGAADVAVVVAAGWLAWWWVVADIEDRSFYRGWLQSCSVAGGVVVAAVVTRRQAWYSQVLSTAPVVWVGRRSYSLYLWYWPIWVMLSPSATGWSEGVLWPVRTVAAVVAASLSYAWVEQPIRSGRGSPARLLAAGGVAMAALAVAVVVFPPKLPPELRDEAVTLGGSGGGGGLEIMVVGDSWARNLGFALALADEDDRHTYVNLGVGGCGLMTGIDPACVPRQQAAWSDVLATRRPDAVVLTTGSLDQGVGARIGGRVTLPCDPAWDAEYARKLDEAITLLQRGPDAIPVYVTTVRDAPRRPEGSVCVNRLLVAAAERSGARVLDLRDKLCPDGGCVSRHGGEPVYDDTGHLAPAGQRWVGAWVLEILQSELTPREPASAASAGPCTSAALDPLPATSYASRPDGAYPDSGGELTDGRRGGPRITDGPWQGWRAREGDIVVTLPAPAAVCAVDSSWLQVLGAAVHPPAVVEVWVSAIEGQLGTRLGVAGPPALSAGDQVTTVRVAAGAPVPGRFVTLRARALAEWSFVDEVTVFGPPR